MRQTILIKELLQSEMVALRASTEVLSEQISLLSKHVTGITLDFSGIQFISRSFADSLVDLMRHFASGVKLELLNMSPSVHEMLATVQSNKGRSYEKRMREDLLPPLNGNGSRQFFAD